MWCCECVCGAVSVCVVQVGGVQATLLMSGPVWVSGASLTLQTVSSRHLPLVTVSLSQLSTVAAAYSHKIIPLAMTAHSIHAI